MNSKIIRFGLALSVACLSINGIVSAKAITPLKMIAPDLVIALPLKRAPQFGYLFVARDIVQGVSPGEYSATVLVENVPIRTFRWTG